MQPLRPQLRKQSRTPAPANIHRLTRSPPSRMSSSRPRRCISCVIRRGVTWIMVIMVIIRAMDTTAGLIRRCRFLLDLVAAFMEAATTVAAFAEVISTEAVCAVVAVARAEEAVVAARAEEAVVGGAPVGGVVAGPAAAA